MDDHDNLSRIRAHLVFFTFCLDGLMGQDLQKGPIRDFTRLFVGSAVYMYRIDTWQIVD